MVPWMVWLNGLPDFEIRLLLISNIFIAITTVPFYVYKIKQDRQVHIFCKFISYNRMNNIGQY